MTRAILIACAPWLGWLAVSFCVLLLLMRMSRARLELRRLLRLHADQQGSAQTLSFVLTLPIFIMVLMFIVQVSQLMIGQVVVEYAAFAAARAAAVWIPAGLPFPEGPNCISTYMPDPEAQNQVSPSLAGPTEGGMTYLIAPGSPKYDKIASAAVMACMPISPSRDLGLSLAGQGPAAADIVKALYAAMAPGSAANAAISRRIENKLAYAMANTTLELRFYHANNSGDAPLVSYPLFDQYGPDVLDPTKWEFQPNELGWQDQITVTVRHNLALLPGPGRLLARRDSAAATGGVGGSQGSSGNVYTDTYTYPLSASATIGNEGEKPVIPYVYQIN